jgi:sugar O-acyltransferase (sialic acid O-acetyltransferase NeuD family)
VKTVVYGSRPDGHAKVVVQLAREAALDLVGLVDDFPENRERAIDGLRVIGTGSDLDALRADGIEAVLLGFGESRGRGSLAERVLAAQLALPRLVHRTAHVYATAELGRGVHLFPLAHVGPDAALNDGALVNTGAIVEHDVVLEAGAVVSPGARLLGRVRVGRDATVGAGAVVFPDVVVGAVSFVGAGAVVRDDVPAGARVAGVPARVLPDRS